MTRGAFDLMVKHKRLSDQLRDDILSWEHTGFSVDGSVRVLTGDHPKLLRLVRYIGRPAVSFERISYDDSTGKVRGLRQGFGLPSSCAAPRRPVACAPWSRNMTSSPSSPCLASRCHRRAPTWYKTSVRGGPASLREMRSRHEELQILQAQEQMDEHPECYPEEYPDWEGDDSQAA